MKKNNFGFFAQAYIGHIPVLLFSLLNHSFNSENRSVLYFYLRCYFWKTFMTGTKSQTVIFILCFNYSMESNPHSTTILIISARGIFRQVNPKIGNSFLSRVFT